MKRNILGLGTTVAILLVSAGSAAADTIRVQSTTDTVDAGLVDGLLKPAYQAAQPGDTLQYTAVGTGKALDNARAGLGDVVITHAPSLEAQFVSDGFSVEPFGRAIFYSDYVVLGPKDDPAGVFAGAPHDAVTAFEKIAAAGEAGHATFVSRGDNSGTNVQEQVIWGLGDVTKQDAANASGNPARKEPGSGGSYPAWYRKTSKGQAANVQETDVCAPASYPNGGCYTMVDRGTFNRLANSQTITKLKIVDDKNTAAARGGEDLLVNPFSAYIVNPAAIAPNVTPRPNVAAATRFLDFLTSPAFQAAVDGFPSASDPAFHSDAFPQVDVSPALPPTAAAGAAVPLDLTLSNKLPGGGVIDGLPVQLQQSTNGGATFTDVGGPVPTDAAGKVRLRPTLAATTSYRVTLPRYRQFSPSVSDLGVVSLAPPTTTPPTTTVPATTPPRTTTPATTPVPPLVPKAPVPTRDTAKPRVTKITLSGRRLSLVLSEPGSVKATFESRTIKRVKHGRKTRTVVSYRTVRTVTLKGSRAGRVSHDFKALRAGRYRLTLRAVDAAGNVSSRTVTLTLKERKRAT